MKPDLTDKLTPPLDRASSEDMNLNAPSVSGAFIELEQAGKLGELASLWAEEQRILRQLGGIERELHVCNDAAALLNMRENCRKRKTDFVAELKAHVRKLENRKERLERRRAEIRLRISMEAPQLFPCTQRLVAERSFPGTVRGRRQMSSHVAARNAIDGHVDFTNLEICKILDLEFTLPGSAPKEMPPRWADKYGVSSFVQAYLHPVCKNSMQKLISLRRSAARGFTR